jgi:hypothetical protein
LIKNDRSDEAIHLFYQILNEKKILFNEMKKEIRESNIIVTLLAINASSQIGNSSICQSIVGQIPKDFSLSREIENALIDMWVRKFKEFFFI